MKLLAIETATEACSAALDIDNDCIKRFEIVPRQHTQLILPMIDQLLQEADIKLNELDAIAFGQGPGAFTGIRIAMGVVQGLAFAHDLPVIPVSTLAVLAQHSAIDHTHIAAAIDARMQEIYWGLYKRNDSGVMEAITDDSISSPNDYPGATNSSWFGAGSGWKTYPEELQAKFNDNLIGFDADALPSAEDVIYLAKPIYIDNRAISIEEASPLYLRNKVANKN